MTPRNYLLIIDNLGSGGAQNQLTLLARGLKLRGNNVSVFTYFPSDFFKKRLDENNIETYFTHKKGLLGFNLISALQKVIRNNSVEVVISFLDTPNFYASLAKVLSSHKFKLITSYRSMTNFEKLGLFDIQRRKWVNRMSDIIIANSHHERNRWGSFDEANRDKWLTIYNAVDQEKFSPKLNTECSGEFLVVGSIGPAKNGLLVIDAMNKLFEQNIKFNLTWVGQKITSIPERGDYLKQMESRIEKYGLQDYWNWKEPHKEIQLEYYNHKCLILASRIEGLPNVVCEALSCGTPCIVGDVLDHKYLVTDGKEGRLFDPMSVDSLKEAIKRMIVIKEDELMTMRNSCVAKSHELFSMEDYISKYDNLVRSN